VLAILRWLEAQLIVGLKLQFNLIYRFTEVWLETVQEQLKAWKSELP
jgi:hypothetical protein